MKSLKELMDAGRGEESSEQKEIAQMASEEFDELAQKIPEAR